MRANLTPKFLALGIHTLITAGDTLSGPVPHALDIWPHLIHTHLEVGPFTLVLLLGKWRQVS